MSLKSFETDMNALAEKVLEKVGDLIDQHGLDPTASEVLGAVEYSFGGQFRGDFEEWSR